MISAAQLKYGSFFVGYVESKDFYGSEYRKWGDHGQQRAVALNAVSVVVQVFSDGTSARDILELFANLPSDHPHQLCDSHMFWIAGERRKNSVRVVAWQNPKRGGAS